MRRPLFPLVRPGQVGTRAAWRPGEPPCTSPPSTAFPLSCSVSSSHSVQLAVTGGVQLVGSWAATGGGILLIPRNNWLTSLCVECATYCCSPLLVSCFPLCSPSLDPFIAHPPPCHQPQQQSHPPTPLLHHTLSPAPPTPGPQPVRLLLSARQLERKVKDRQVCRTPSDRALHAGSGGHSDSNETKGRPFQ